MPADAQLLLVLAVMVAAGWILSRVNRRDALEDDAPRAVERDAAAAQPGERVRLRGTVRRLEATVEAPISQRPCLAFDLMLEHRARPPTPNRRGLVATVLPDWYEAASETRAVAFLLEDATGAVWVKPEHAALIFVDGPDTLRHVEDRERAFRYLQRRADARLIRDDELRYSEWRVEEGDVITIEGRVEDRLPDPRPSQGYRQAASVAVLRGTATEPMRVALTPGGGPDDRVAPAR